MKKDPLGRGLEALIGREPEPDRDKMPGDMVVYISTDKLCRNRYQPRKNFDQNSLDELEQSIRQSGVIQPILVRKENDEYHLIAGERRLIAARQAGLKEVPALVRDIDNPDEILEIALIENIQREDLNPIEEARSYRRLINEFDMTQEDVSRKVGKSRSSVANIIRLLDLDTEIQNMLEGGKINFAQARLILSIPEGDRRIALARRAAGEGIPVRRLKELILKGKKPSAKKNRADTSRERIEQPHLIELSATLREKFKTKIDIKTNPKGGGRIEIEFFSPEDLRRIIDIIV